MIAGGLPTRAYYASQGGFDTHAGQLGTHDRLMTELNGRTARTASTVNSSPLQTRCKAGAGVAPSPCNPSIEPP
jgi:hypothetical protein